jgi:hypothetical protein
MNALATVNRNQTAAATFVTELSRLNPQWYGQIQIGDVDSEPYASARYRVSRLWELARTGPATQMAAFIVTSNEMISQANLPPAVDILAQAMVSAILVRNLDDGERALRTLYETV